MAISNSRCNPAGRALFIKESLEMAFRYFVMSRMYLNDLDWTAERKL